ncbi:MAG TPA: hypothetical protein ENG83_15135 [Nitrospirae bacterium]|nr:hypothetical protein [Nitrospirota bacterium]HDZ01057.1 hypothetical protein [Nitrospirota bacterium]
MSRIIKRKYSKIIRNRKQRIERRLRRKQWENQSEPIMKGSNIHYEMSEKNKAINCGGIGVFHQMAKKTGLIKEIDANLKLLKVHIPYHESDHVLNIAYNILAGGMRLEDIEIRRKIGKLFDLRSELVHGGISSIDEWQGLDHYESHFKSTISIH